MSGLDQGSSPGAGPTQPSTLMPPGDRNAMTGALYLSRIEVTDHAITGYWEQYGYSYAGEVPASLLRPGKY